MKYFALDLTALSPLAIRADHAPGGAANAPYISGTTLAGSLASVHRLLYAGQDHAQEAFERLFLSEQIQYPNLYPANRKDKKKPNNSEKQGLLPPVYPLPKTAQSCKRFSGFLPLAGEEKGEDAGHGVRDTLFDWTVFELGDRSYAALQARLLDDRKRYCQHPQCKQDKGKPRPMHHFSAFYRRVEKPVQTIANTRLQTYTGIDRRTGTVQEGILYQRQVFEEDSCFSGILKMAEDEQLAGELQRFIQQASQQGLIRIGTGRTRGLGKVEISLSPLPTEQLGFTAFKKRLVDFQERLSTALREAGVGVETGRFYFALTLHSPAIICDEVLRYRGSIDAAILGEFTQSSIAGLRRVYQAADTARVTGWNELWGTPRVQEWAIESGSVFLFSCLAPPDDTLYHTLFKLEEAGIGQRRTEGFGRVCISDPFHLEETPQ